MTIEVAQIHSEFYQMEKMKELAGTVNGLSGVYSNRGIVKVGAKATTNADVAGKTIASTFILQSRPSRVRLHLLNVHTAPINGVKASVAPSENISSPFVPSGTVSSFKTFSIGGTIPAATINTGTDNVVPSELASGWLNPLVVPRTDGEGFILMLRVYQDATATVANRMTVGGLVATTDSKYKVRTAISTNSGDFTTTTASFTEGGLCPAFWLEVDYETPSASLLTVGDSIMAGANSGPAATGSCAYGAAFIAVSRLQSDGRKIAFANGGWSGAAVHGFATTQLPDVISGYLGQFLSYVENGARPTIAAFCPWSVNNGGTYTNSQLSSVRQSIGVFMATCDKNKITPVLVTPAPRNGLTESDESFRRLFVQYIKEYCQKNNIVCIDRDSVYTNYDSVNGGYKLPEWCLDDVHPTEAGHEAESVEWYSKLNSIL